MLNALGYVSKAELDTTERRQRLALNKVLKANEGLDKRIDTLEETLQKKTQQLSQSQAELKETKKAYEALQKDHEALVQHLEEHTTKHTRLQHSYNLITSATEQTEQEFNDRINALTKENDHLKNDAVRSLDIINNLTQQTERMKEIVEQNERLRTDVKDVTKDTDERIQAIQDDCDRRMQEQFNACKEQVDRHKDQVANTLTELDLLKRRYAIVSQQVAAKKEWGHLFDTKKRKTSLSVRTHTDNAAPEPHVDSHVDSHATLPLRDLSVQHAGF